MLFLTKSFFLRISFALIVFTIAIAGLYTDLLLTSIYALEDKLLQDYMTRELEEYTQLTQDDKKHASLPSTSYFKTYWEHDELLPDKYKNYALGFYEEFSGLDVNEDIHLLVAKVDGHDSKLFMFLNEAQFSTISRNETTLRTLIYSVAGFVIITGIITATFIARRLSKPVTELAQDATADWYPNKRFIGYDRQDEIGDLSREFTDLVQKLRLALDSEKSFSRHASHEMRTPLALIRNALSVLKLPSSSEEKRQRNLERIEQACTSAEKMMDVFLCLGQSSAELPKQSINLLNIVENSINSYREIKFAKNIDISISAEENSTINASLSLTEVLIDNLVRNALTHGYHTLEITINKNQIHFSNQIDTQQPKLNNYGYGLEIVNRVCDLMRWQYTHQITATHFNATISFETHSKTTFA